MEILYLVALKGSLLATIQLLTFARAKFTQYSNLGTINDSHQIKSFIILVVCNTPKRVMGMQGPSPRHCARAT